MRKCVESRPCFAKNRESKYVKCRILTSTYPDGKCPFCKPEMEVTNGKRYPFDMEGYRKNMQGRSGKDEQGEMFGGDDDLDGDGDVYLDPGYLDLSRDVLPG